MKRCPGVGALRSFQFPSPVELAAREAIVRRVRAVFNDGTRGEQPVERRHDALFPPGSVIWQVHGDVVAMMVGGISALLLQMLHPAALAGVWDHSSFRHDMLGRLRRTARFIALTTYGSAGEAEAAIARVRRIHAHVSGRTPQGDAYSASDPHLLAWVHVAEASSFLAAHQVYGGRRLRGADRDRYYLESGQIAERLGADPVPKTQAEADALIRAMRGDLLVDGRTREVARLILDPPVATPAAAPIQRIVAQAAVDLLPPWGRQMLGLPGSGIGRPLVRAATAGAARTIRWAFSASS